MQELERSLSWRNTSADLRNLVHIKSIILRNNSFTGIIPEGIGELKELEVLDFGLNNFTGPLPPDLGSNLSLTILLLDNNRLLGNLSPEIHHLKTHSEFQADETNLLVLLKDHLAIKDLPYGMSVEYSLMGQQILSLVVHSNPETSLAALMLFKVLGHLLVNHQKEFFLHE
ncbi:hypothetical protein GH714_037277 [Hevea brasiliensis]|uniref:Leucine-rich repeat-containing N-terminal plant-type domain-containing protein n=1 Tax=Hevea brasiliensis TaxID=3981 RepID=A0A6A6L5M0_HEVBR|nr:hypothetical protein GH714_037277 [Hevea brasiliensis]